MVKSSYSKIFRKVLVAVAVCGGMSVNARVSYPVVDTGQVRCYSNSVEIEFPAKGKVFHGQDAMYQGNSPKYKDNKNGTVRDLVTGLMWTQEPGEKMTFDDAVKNASKCRAGGYRDWRLPTIKELYSLIDFSGEDVDMKASTTAGLKPFINTKYFKFQYGDSRKGERIIDSQFATSTKYAGTTMGGNETMFGVNFADGRIKGYPAKSRHRQKKYYVLYVRGNKNYGKNKFVDNGDGTITDKATGLTWMKVDSGKGMTWQDALKYAEKLKYAGKSDWRLPNAKELQSIVDYSRSPSKTNSPAISKMFKVTTIKGEDGKKAYPFYWSSTTHKRSGSGVAGVYFSFGKGYGWMTDRRTGKKALMDVHGAGCQRSDPKVGDPKKTPYGRGPQGDVLRIYNFVRCVRGGQADPVSEGPKLETTKSRSKYGKKESSSSEKGQKTKSGFMQREDINGDGKVSKDEFRGPSSHFNRFDKNKDGYISEDEAPKGPPKRR